MAETLLYSGGAEVSPSVSLASRFPSAEGTGAPFPSTGWRTPEAIQVRSGPRLWVPDYQVLPRLQVRAQVETQQKRQDPHKILIKLYKIPIN